MHVFFTSAGLHAEFVFHLLVFRLFLRSTANHYITCTVFADACSPQKHAEGVGVDTISEEPRLLVCIQEMKSSFIRPSSGCSPGAQTLGIEIVGGLEFFRPFVL